MKRLFAFLLFNLGFGAIAATVSYQALNTNQFFGDPTNGIVALRPGVTLTNPISNGGGNVLTRTLNIQLYSNNVVISNGTYYRFTNSTSAGITDIVSSLPPQYLSGSNRLTLSISVAANTICDISAPFLLSNMNYRVTGQGNKSSWFRWAGPTNWTSPGEIFTNPVANAMMTLLTPNNSGGYSDFANIGDCSVENIGFTTKTNFPIILLIAAGERNVINNCTFAGADAFIERDNNSTMAVIGLAMAGISGSYCKNSSFYDLAVGCYIPNQNFMAPASKILSSDCLLEFENNEGYEVGADANGTLNVYTNGNSFMVGALLNDAVGNNSSRVIHNHVTIGTCVLFNQGQSSPSLGVSPFYTDNILEGNFGLYQTYSVFSTTCIGGIEQNLQVTTVDPDTYLPTLDAPDNLFNIAWPGPGSKFRFGLEFGGIQVFSVSNTGTIFGDGAGITNQSITYFTNIVSGKPQTNTSKLSMTWRVPVVVSEPAAVLGKAMVDAKVQAPGGVYVSIDDASISGGATSIIQTNNQTLNFEVPVSWGFVVTNTTSGAGYVAALDSTKTNQLTLHP